MGIAASNGIMGFIHKEQGNYEAAMAYFKKVLTFQEDLGDKRSIATSVGNMGVIYLAKGEYQRAMACFEEDLTISEELGYKKGISLAVYHIGIVHREQGDYETALACYDRAITIGKEAGIRPFLCGYLLAKAEVCFLQQRFDQARTLSVEGLAIAQEIGRKEQVFQGNLLVAKINFVLGQRGKAVALLSEMLAQTDKNVEQADVHYELYHWNVDPEEHRKQALTLYQGLYSKTPKSVWKKRITELESAVDICVDPS
jgi:tetratricopeptide (TPR) repeat protein